MRLIKPYEEIFDTYPLLRAVAPLCIGIAAAECFYAEITPLKPWLLLIIGLCTAICLVHTRLKRRHRLSVTFNTSLMVAFAAAGMLLLCAQRDSLTPSEEVHEGTCRSVVTSLPKRTKSTWQVNAVILDGAYRGKTIRLSLLDKDSTSSSCVNVGDGILISTRISPLKRKGNPNEFDFSAYLRRQGLSGEAFCYEKRWAVCNEALKASFHSHLSPWQRLKIKALEARTALTSEYAEHFEGSSLGIISAIALGDKSRIDAATRQLFSQTGASHILALSGLHISILFAMYCLIARRISPTRKVRKHVELFGVALLWGFAFLVGMPLSLVRAVIMFSIFQVMDTLEMSNASINNLALALLIILTASPMSLFDVGLQLSFLAVLAIQLFSPLFPHTRWMETHPKVKFFYSLLILTLCAQVGTAPVVAYYFHNIPLTALLSNFIVIPLSYPILAGSLLFLLLPSGLQIHIAPVLDFLLTAMQSTLDIFGKLPLSSIEVRPTLLTTFLCFAGIALTIAYFHTRRLKYAVFFCSLLLLCGVYEIYDKHPARTKPQIVFYNLPGHPAIHCIASSSESYLWTKKGRSDSSALHHIKETFWDERLTASPRWIEGDAETERFCRHAPFILFGGKCIMTLNDGLWHLPEKSGAQTDILFLSRGVKGSLAKAFESLRPKEIILDASLSEHLRHRYRHECDSANVACHDISEEGARIIHIGDGASEKNP